MNFLSLKYFLVLAEELSFTQSAEQLHISQQSLSAHIGRLEKECGLQLFNREPPLCLTRAGEEFAVSARIILREKESLEKRMADLLQNHKSVVTIGVPISRSTILMPRVLQQFHREYPDIQIRLIEGTSDDIYNLLQKGHVDLILGFKPEQCDKLDVHPLYVEYTKIVVPNIILNRMPNRTSLLEAKGPVRLREFANVPFVALHESTQTGSLLQLVADEDGFAPNVVITTKILMTMLALCCEGVGVCICPNSFLRSDSLILSSSFLNQVTIFSLDSPQKNCWITVSRLKSNYLSVPEKRLIHIIEETYKNTPIE